jgi:hypothetical protein
MDWTTDHEGEESFTDDGHGIKTGIVCHDPDILY